MAVDVLTEIEIRRPRGDVAAFAGDPANAAAWYQNIKSVEWETTPPPELGSRIRFVAQFLGRTLRYTYEIREIVPGRRFVMRLLPRNRVPRPGQARFGFPSEPSLVPKVVQHTRLAYTVRERAFTIEIGLRVPVRHDATFVERAVDQQTGESTGTCTTRTGATNSVADVDVSIPARIAADGRTVRFGTAQATISGEDRLSVQGFEPRAIDDTIAGPATGTGRFAHAVTTPCPAGSPRNIGGRLRCRG